MTPTVRTSFVDRFAYPRLTLTIAAGVTLLALAAALYLLGPFVGPEFQSLGVQVAILAYLILLIGTSGRIAFAIFERAR